MEIKTIMCGNADTMTETSRQLFLTLDQEQLIQKFSLDADEENIYISFLGQTYAVNRVLGNVVIPGSFQPLPVDVVMAIYNVLTHSAEVQELPVLSGTWYTLNQLGGLLAAGHTAKLQTPEVLKPFEGKVDELRKVCEDMGGIPAKGGDVSYQLPVFPFLPMWFQYWDADDEFPASVQFLWDKDAEKLLHFEILHHTTAYIESLLANLVSK
ncbi:MAG: DUF3786 domain-containing protein [Eubacteriales bacterium]|nr:DUF3786 domain-containing protein [Eubacteriales bacterium]